MKNKRGEGYIDTVVEVLVFTMLLVMSLNVFHFLKLKLDMDHFAKELITASATSGSTSGQQVAFRYEELVVEMNMRPTCSWTAEYFNASAKKVQLGDTIVLTMTMPASFEGFGIFNLPFTVTVKQSAVSQKYWKGTG